MKTKLLCLIVAMIAVIAMLASCGGGNNGGGGTGDEGTGNEGGAGDPAITYNVTWQKTDITVKLTNHSNSSELTSGCKRYYAGADTSAFQEIDSNIRARNQLAQRAANVKTTWSWIEDSEDKGWGANINDMVADVCSGSQNIPDIYCNFAYDMTCAALRGCFSNLLKTDYANGNHFRFTASDYKKTVDPTDYFNSLAGEGYFYQYMRSLSLTPDTKLYLVASNYTIDVIRSMVVMPVNVELMNSISVSDSYAGDRDGDGDHDIEDFYALVWDGGWDYTALAAYAKAIYQAGSGSDPLTDLSDNCVGLALGQGSDLTASGLLYTTSVKILEKQADGSYKYPTTNHGLNEFVTALNNLITHGEEQGICVVDADEGKAVEPYASTELDAIRSRFASNNVLFGGIVLVGSLEDYEYQRMNYYDSGFGIVPVPVYKTGEEYKTLVHNLARIMGISKATTKFAQCSAYLDYQSRTSEQIVVDYCTNQFANAVDGAAGKHNAKMFNYIRNHVNDCFDMTFEDAIANYAGETDANAMSTRFHDFIMNNGYKVNSFSTVYDAIYTNKQKYLDEVWASWNGLE